MGRFESQAAHQIVDCCPGGSLRRRVYSGQDSIHYNGCSAEQTLGSFTAALTSQLTCQVRYTHNLRQCSTGHMHKSNRSISPKMADTAKCAGSNNEQKVSSIVHDG